MKKFEKIVIASDLDGTYFGQTTRLVERNLKMVRYFCDNGGHFTFNTGRLPHFMRRSLPNAKELINMPAITGNGTCLYDFQNERALEEHFLDAEAMIKMLEFVRAYSDQFGIRGTTREGFVIPTFENSYTSREYYSFPDFMEKKVTDIENWGQLDIYKINLMNTDVILSDIYSLLKQNFSNCLQISRSSSHLIEIMPFGTSKGVMLKKAVKDLFGEETMICTVGDYDNDLEMHEIADLPVCPSNANERVKAVCRQCFCSNEEGVIADLIEFLDK